MEIVKNVGETISKAAPGLNLSNAISEIGAEAKRMGQLGASELANGLLNGHGFVLYGPGQRPAEAEKAIEPPDAPGIESPQQSHGRSM
jgi:hypothetical protein